MWFSQKCSTDPIMTVRFVCFPFHFVCSLRSFSLFVHSLLLLFFLPLIWSFVSIVFVYVFLCSDDFHLLFLRCHRDSLELPSTKLHTLLLDHRNVKLTWYIDWPKKEVLFNVDDAFTDDNDWFSFGFSKRGQIEGSDVCFFVKSFYDESYNEAIVSIVWRLPLLYSHM